MALERTSAASLHNSGNRLDLLQNGPDTYDDWLSAIAGARRWVHLDNYIFSDDEVGSYFAEALRHKAAEGVPVRVLYDWFGCLSTPRSF
jgi:cardiolipin synthase